MARLWLAWIGIAATSVGIAGANEDVTPRSVTLFDRMSFEIPAGCSCGPARLDAETVSVRLYCGTAEVGTIVIGGQWALTNGFGPTGPFPEPYRVAAVAPHQRKVWSTIGGKDWVMVAEFNVGEMFPEPEPGNSATRFVYVAFRGEMDAWREASISIPDSVSFTGPLGHQQTRAKPPEAACADTP